jgi:hypothetical protein
VPHLPDIPLSLFILAMFFIGFCLFLAGRKTKKPGNSVIVHPGPEPMYELFENQSVDEILDSMDFDFSRAHTLFPPIEHILRDQAPPDLYDYEAHGI